MPDEDRTSETSVALDPKERDVFLVMNEIGILSQLTSTLLETKLPEAMTVRHFGVMNHLSRRPEGQTPLALANAFQVPKTSMTHTLSGLEERGLVEMRPNPGDGRSKIVVLTAAGLATRDAAIAALRPEIADVLKSYGATRIAALLPLLTELRLFLDAARD